MCNISRNISRNNINPGKHNIKLLKIHMAGDVVEVEVGVEEGAGAAEVDMAVVGMADTADMEVVAMAGMGTTKDTIRVMETTKDTIRVMETIKDTIRVMETIRDIKKMAGMGTIVVVVGVVEEYTTVVLDTKEAEVVEGEAMSVAGEGWAAVEGETKPSEVHVVVVEVCCSDACLVSVRGNRSYSKDLFCVLVVECEMRFIVSLGFYLVFSLCFPSEWILGWAFVYLLVSHGC